MLQGQPARADGFFQLAVLLVQGCQIRQRVKMVWAQLQGPLVAGLSLLHRAQPLQHRAQVTPGIHRRRRQLQLTPEAGDGLLRPVLLQQDEAQGLPGHQQIRLVLESQQAAGLGLVKPPLRGKHLCQLAMRLGQVGLDGHGPLVIGHGVIHTRQRVQGGGAVEIHERARLGRGLDGPADQLHGLRKSARMAGDDAQHMQGIGKIGRQPEGLLAKGLRRRQPTRFQMCHRLLDKAGNSRVQRWPGRAGGRLFAQAALLVFLAAAAGAGIVTADCHDWHQVCHMLA